MLAVVGKMSSNKNKWRQALKDVGQIEGLLVPGQEKALMVLASALKKKSTIVEIGSFKGKSTACLAFGSPKTAKVYAIDTFEGNKKDFLEGVQFMGKNFYDEFVENLERVGLFYKIVPLKGFSANIGKKWDKPIDLLFIDGSHVYEDVKQDFELFYPWVKPGGMVVFHDVDQKFPGVKKVWDEISEPKLSGRGQFFTLRFGFKPRYIFSRFVDFIKIKFLSRQMK